MVLSSYIKAARPEDIILEMNLILSFMLHRLQKY